MRHFQHIQDQKKLRKVAYVNGRIKEMLKQGEAITPFVIVKLEVEGKKLMLSSDQFIRLISELKDKFDADQQIHDYFEKISKSPSIMTPC